MHMPAEDTLDINTTQTAVRGEELISQTSEIPLLQQKSLEAYAAILNTSLMSDIHPEMYDAVLSLASCLSELSTQSQAFFEELGRVVGQTGSGLKTHAHNLNAADLLG
jgi:hypothetical protein